MFRIQPQTQSLDRVTGGALPMSGEVAVDELIADILRWIHGIERDQSQEDYVLIA
ncbi:hypothetical protein [Arthrobacter sp. NicSoilC5]|uniref:hypothetical protein n=1 Tax=Arthrobacter sp. NicSoilC5 TaxID=2831000 RepID=UPI001CC55158|nr:hypothetical protein [Arthrobacter sp. NicSoilC5]BCW78994.1 hypothetical protein NicSoilC5_10130 [Arthrobacter sp. NicSoilC5]